MSGSERTGAHARTHNKAPTNVWIARTSVRAHSPALSSRTGPNPVSPPVRGRSLRDQGTRSRSVTLRMRTGPCRAGPRRPCTGGLDPHLNLLSLLAREQTHALARACEHAQARAQPRPFQSNWPDSSESARESTTSPACARLLAGRLHPPHLCSMRWPCRGGPPPARRPR